MLLDAILILILVGAVSQAQQAPSDADHPLHPHHKNHGGSTKHTVLLTVPVIVLSLAVIAITLAVIYVLHKARYGEFCCMKPYRRIRRRFPLTDDRDDVAHNVVAMLPPGYDCSYLRKESPPVYRDALQDRVLVSGTVALPPYTEERALANNPDPPHEVAPTTLVNETHLPPPASGEEEDSNGGKEEEEGRQSDFESSTLLLEH